MAAIPELRIGELARRVGLTPEVLRAWERRYGLLRPSRSGGGFRLYSRADELRIQRMQRELARGLSPAEAARATLSADEEQAPPAAPVADFGRLRRELGEALERYDDAAANAILDDLIGQFTLDSVLAEVVLPLLRDIGDRWQDGELSIGQEHFASNVVRGRLLALARGWSRGIGPLAVLACPPGERHDIPLVAFGLALHSYGWRITFLGADTPIEAVATAAESASVAVLASRDARLFAAVADEIAALAARLRVALAGPGATEDAAARTGARLLTAGPLEAARDIAMQRV
jgi:MerR family transcriptional regulator, light-induced transcriptional regulator